MVTVKRQRKRSLQNQKGKYLLVGGAALFAIMLGLIIALFADRAALRNRLDDLSDYMAKSIRTDLNQALQYYDNIDRRSADLTGDVLPNMKKYMYSAYNTNKLLVEARGESYSIIDTATYNSFQTLAGEFERLLANGQSTAAVKTSMGDYMQAIETVLSSRFDSADLLLPKTASK